MAGYSLWVAVLSLFCLLSAVQLDKVVVVPLEADPAIDTEQVCVHYSDGHFLRIIDVYDMINERLQQYIQGGTYERVMEFMRYGDNNLDERLDLIECKILVNDIVSGRLHVA